MGKIEVEDFTKSSDELRSINIMALANALIQSAGETGLFLGLKLEDSCVALHVAAKVLGIVGEKSGNIENLDKVKENSLKYVYKRLEELEKSGTMDIILSIKDKKEKG